MKKAEIDMSKIQDIQANNAKILKKAQENYEAAKKGSKSVMEALARDLKKMEQ